MVEGIRFPSGSDGDLFLDLFIPTTGEGPFPVALYLSGFGAEGHTEQLWRQAARLASKGVAGVAMQYSQNPEGWIRIPEARDDVLDGLTYLQRESSYDLDFERVAAVGASQGGYLAALLATSDLRDIRIMAVAVYNAPLDLEDFRYRGSASFPAASLGIPYERDSTLWRRLSPINRVSSAAPPFLFLHGTGDRTVPYQQSVAMALGLLETGVRAEIFTAADGAHGFFLHPPWFEPTTTAMEDFLLRMLVDADQSATAPDGDYDRVPEPTFPPEGRRVAFVRRVDGRAALFVMRVGEPEATRLTDAQGNDRAPAWSPDGTSLAFQSDRGGDFDLFRLDLETGSLSQLTFADRSGGPSGGPSWSPDGNRIAFLSDRSGSVEMFVMHSDGSGAEQLTTTPGGEGHPSWSPDGRSILHSLDRKLYLLDLVSRQVRELTGR